MRIHDTQIVEENGKFFIVYIHFDGEKYVAFKSAEIFPVPVRKSPFEE